MDEGTRKLVDTIHNIYKSMLLLLYVPRLSYAQHLNYYLYVLCYSYRISAHYIHGYDSARRQESIREQKKQENKQTQKPAR